MAGCGVSTSTPEKKKTSYNLYEYYNDGDDGDSPTLAYIWNSTGLTVVGTLTVNGDQTGATDHVFDSYDDIELLKKWKSGDDLPFNKGEILNRDNLLRDSILQMNTKIVCQQRQIYGLGFVMILTFSGLIYLKVTR